jgi:hypothetical protein
MNEMNRICLVLFAMNNRIFGPYLAAIDRILISGMGNTHHWSEKDIGGPFLPSRIGQLDPIWHMQQGTWILSGGIHGIPFH